MGPARRTADLSAYPDLAVILLGMRVRRASGLPTLLYFGREIARSVARRPEGLLAHEDLAFSLLPPHLGMRQYWRDFASLEAWTRELPHARWWKRFRDDPAGVGFWHELYLRRGGMEAVYMDIDGALGFLRFAPSLPAEGPRATSRQRLDLPGSPPPAP